MPISRNTIKQIVRDAIEEVTDALVDDEVDEIADIAAQKFIDEDPNSYDDDELSRDVPDDVDGTDAKD